MSEPILPFIAADDVGKSEATVVKVDGREIKKNPIDVGEDGLRILQIIAGVISASTKSLGSSIRHIFLENGKLSVSTADVGSSKKPVYMANGEVKASDANVGSRVKPVYMEGGEIKESNANVGDDGLRLLKMVNGELQVSTSSKGSDIKFVYVQNGEVKETSVTLGSSVKHIYLQDGELKVSDSSVGGKIEVYDATTDENPEVGKHYFKREADNTYTDITSELSIGDDLQAMGYTVFELKETRFAPAVLKGGSIVVDDANVGSNACFLYMQNGELKASTLTAGTNAKLLKIVNGEVKEATDNIGGEGRLLKIVNGQIVGDDETTVGDGSSIVYLSEGKLVKSSDTVGTDTKPVKLENGSLVAVTKDLATKESPALERYGEVRDADSLTEAEKQVPTAPTPKSTDPGSMIATKEYVDNLSTEKVTYGYGVVDGTICTDAGDNPCVTHHQYIGTSATELEYEVKNDCYLYIEINGTSDVAGGTDHPAIDVYVNGSPMARLLDHWDKNTTDFIDVPSCGIPVAKGSIVKLSCNDGANTLFATWTDGVSDLVVTEYRLASISPTIEMPKYDRDEAFDIHVAAFSEDGYVAPRRGYLLASIFDERGIYVPSNKSMKIYINDVLVMNGRNIIKQVLTDSRLKQPELFSTDEGSIKDVLVTTGATITLDHPSSYKVYERIASPATEQYEYDLILDPGTLTDSTLTFKESLVGKNVVVVDGARHIEDIELTDTGCCLIPVNYHDVIKIRTSEGNVDYSGNASSWPSNIVYNVTSDTTPDLNKRYYKETDGGMVEVTDEVRAASDMTAMSYIVYEGVYVDANHDGSIDPVEHRWQALFLRTRQTGADTEPGALDRDDFVMGGFMDGTMFQDDQGNDIFVEVPYTKWALTQDADGLYTYKYIVKKDCMLYISFLVHAHSTNPDKVKITLNGREFDYYYENDATLSTTISDSDKQLMLPIAAGTVVGFHSKAQPNHNIIGTADTGAGTYAIKIKEYKLIASGETADVSNIRVGGGVIDGTVSNVSEVDLTVAGNNKPTYTYKTTKDCLLLIEVNKAVIGASAIQVQVGSTTVGYLSDNESTDTDNDSMRIPVRANTDIVLVGDGTSNIFSSTPEGSVLRFTELKLTAIAKQVGMPDYDSGVDITNEVTRVTATEPRGYQAPSDGYVKFVPPTNYVACYIEGLVNNEYVYCSGLKDTGSASVLDWYHNIGMVPVRAGDVIDLRITDTPNLPTEPANIVTGTGTTVVFYPLKTVGEINVGCVELPIIEHQFDSIVDNPFLDYTKVDKTKLSFTSDTLRKMGYDIDVAKADIRTKIDVFYPRYDVLGNLMKDANGHVMVDTNKPMFRFEPMVYDQTAGGYGADDVPFSVQRTGAGASTALICWPTLGATSNVHMLLRGFNAFKTSVSTPEIDPNIRPTHHMVSGVDTTDLTYRPSEADWAATRGFTGYYIRLTAVVDPRSPNVKVSKSGMFIDGQINVDDNGNACKTLVTYDKWAANGNVTDGYTYEYIVKTDCLLYMNVGLEMNNTTQEEVVIKINGETLDAYTDTGMSTSGQLIDLNKILALPLSRGTKVSFCTKTTPVHNQRTAGGALPGGEDFIIKLIEFKMSTELNPAQFPSLSVRVFDIQNNSAADQAEFLNRHYTWTEDQLKQVFGSMFSLDEAKIDFRAVFYTGDAITAYDTTTNKVEDPFVEITDNGANHVHKLSAVVLDNDGTKTLDVMVPQLPYFVSGVTWDSVNGKVVLRNQRTGIGGDLAVAAGVRMRLLMHISDRRGEVGDSYPNGIASTSKMVRQGDMNLIPTTSGANYTYSNEITVTESGWCIIHANYDTDGGILNGTTTYSVQIQAFISNAWTDVAMQDNKSLSSSINTDYGWDFTFPVEAGLKLRARTNFNNDGTGLTDFKSGTYPYTRRQQALCWVIPTSKYLNPEQNLPGSAGVIDGSVWKYPNGDPVSDVQTCDNVKTVYTYNVKNDCMLNIVYNNSGIDRSVEPVVKVNGTEVCRFLMIGARGSDRDQVMIPVAEGSVVTLTNDAGTAVFFDDNSGTLTFTEFKLRATNVVAAMPDWSTEGTTLTGGTESAVGAETDGSVIQADGWLVIEPRMQSTNVPGQLSVYINHKLVAYCHRTEVYEDCNTTVIPVSKGDILTYTRSDTVYVPRFTWYPVKMHEIKSEVVEEAIDVLSKVDEVTLVDAAANSDIFNAAQALMSNTAIAPSTNDGTNDHPAGQFPVPTWTGYDTVVRFMKGVTEDELRTMTGNSLLSLRNVDIEIKLVTYSLSGGGTFETVEQYEEIDPLVYVGNNTGPRNIISTIKPIISKVGSNRTIRVPWPGKFATNSTSHWSTDGSTFFPAQYGDLIALGSSIRARVILVIKQRSSSSGS